MREQTPDRYILVTQDLDACQRQRQTERNSPRQDFAELALALNATILSFSDTTHGSLFTRWLARTAGPAVALAWLAFRRRGVFYFATAENTAIPLALLLKFRKGATLTFVGHRITTPMKSRLIRIFRLFNQIHCMFCYNRHQEQFATETLRAAPHQVRRIVFLVDEVFFTPPAHPLPHQGVVSVGRELRDYPTLFKALEHTGVPVTVVASSPWSKREDQTKGRTIPPNVTLKTGLSSEQLRDLYRSAAVVVVPLMNVDWPAGVTSLYEAQACGRPVVISASAGIMDSIEAGSARMVPCGDADAMRTAVMRLIQNPSEAEALGRAGRESVLHAHTLSQYVERIVAGCASESGTTR